jgi:hypothetical protein
MVGERNMRSLAEVVLQLCGDGAWKPRRTLSRGRWTSMPHRRQGLGSDGGEENHSAVCADGIFGIFFAGHKMERNFWVVE